MRTDSFGDAGNEQRVPTGCSLVGCSRTSKHFVCVCVCVCLEEGAILLCMLV